MYFPSSQATVLVVRPDDADSTIFPKRITLLEIYFPGSHFFPERQFYEPTEDGVGERN
jgi:hypothetical protein